MVQLIRTNNTHEGFRSLVRDLDAELAIRDGDDHDFYHQFNGIESIPYVVVATELENPIGCGALKPFDNRYIEVKRVYTPPNQRGKGVARAVMQGLEIWAKELGYERCILETGINQPEAIALYKKLGYQPMENYGQYAGVETSYCFQKRL